MQSNLHIVWFEKMGEYVCIYSQAGVARCKNGRYRLKLNVRRLVGCSQSKRGKKRKQRLHWYRCMGNITIPYPSLQPSPVVSSVIEMKFFGYFNRAKCIENTLNKTLMSLQKRKKREKWTIERANRRRTLLPCSALPWLPEFGFILTWLILVEIYFYHESFHPIMVPFWRYIWTLLVCWFVLCCIRRERERDKDTKQSKNNFTLQWMTLRAAVLQIGSCIFFPKQKFASIAWRFFVCSFSCFEFPVPSTKRCPRLTCYFLFCYKGYLRTGQWADTKGKKKSVIEGRRKKQTRTDKGCRSLNNRMLFDTRSIIMASD